MYYSWIGGKNWYSLQEMLHKIEVHKNQRSFSQDDCKPNASVVRIKARQRSVPSPQSNCEENLIPFDCVTGTFLLD